MKNKLILLLIICLGISLVICSCADNVEKQTASSKLSDSADLDINRAEDVAEQYCTMLKGKFSSMKSIEYTGQYETIGDDVIILEYDVVYEGNINKQGLVRVEKDSSDNYKVKRMDEN